MFAFFRGKIRKTLMFLAAGILLAFATIPVSFAQVVVNFGSKSIDSQEGGVTGVVDGDNYNIVLENPVTNTMQIAGSTSAASVVNIKSNSATPGTDTIISEIYLRGLYGQDNQPVTLNLEDTDSKGKVVVERLYSQAYTYFKSGSGFDIVLSDKGYGSAFGEIDFSSGFSTSTITDHIKLTFHHENDATGVAQVTGDVNLSDAKIMSAGITVESDMTGYSIIGGTYTGSAGADVFTFDGSATIDGEVDLRAGSNIINLGNGKTVKMLGGLKATGGEITLRGGTGDEILETNVDISDNNNKTFCFDNDTLTLKGSVTGGENAETLRFQSSATITGTVNLGTSTDIIAVLSNKTATLSGALNISGDDSADAMVRVLGAGSLNVSGTTTISGTSGHYGELEFGNSGANTFSEIVLAGSASDKAALIDVNDGTSNTATKLTVSADKYGKLDVATDTTTFSAETTEVKSGGTLQIIVANTDEDVDLGALTLSGGTLDITDTARAATVKLDSLSIINGDVTINASATGGAEILKIASGTVDLQSTLIYDSSAVKFVDSNNDAITLTGNTIDIGGTPVNPDYSSGNTQKIENNGRVTGLGLDNAANTRTAEITENSTIVGTSAETVETNNTLVIDYGSTYIQNTGALNAGNGTVVLDGKLTISGDASTVGTLNTTGTTGVISGKNITVNTLNINDGQKVNIAGTVTLGTANNVSGAVELAGADKDTSGIIEIDNASSTFATFNVAADKYGVIKDSGGGSADALTVNGGTISGHLLLGSNADLVVNGGTLKISKDTLQMANGSSLSIGTTGSLSTIGTSGDLDDGHIKVDAKDGSVATTIRNQSTIETNTIGWLDVDGGDTGAIETAAVTINNRNAADTADAAAKSYLTINKADITAGNNAGDAASVLITAGTKTMDVKIIELNISGVANAKLTSSGLADTDITTANFAGITGIIDNQVAGTAGEESTIMDIGTLNADATDAAVTARLTSTTTNNDSISEITTMNITGTAANTGKVILDNDNTGTHKVKVGTVNFISTIADKAELNLDQANGTLSTEIDNIVVAADNYGYLSNDTGVATFKDATVNGTLKFSNALTAGNGTSGKFTIGEIGSLITVAGNLTVAAGGEVYVTASAAGHASIDTAGNTIDLTVAGSRLTLDLGRDNQDTVTAGTAKYARIATSDDISAVRDGTTVTTVYAVNGMSGTQYDDVFMSSTIIDDDILSSDNNYLTYTVKAGSGGNIHDIVVSTNSSNISSEVLNNGGTVEGVKAADYLVTNQAGLNVEGQNYVTRLTSLTGADFARGADETAGVEATTQTAQSAQLGVQQSVGAVKNQMTAFRQGALSSGMASSFSGGGATAALSDMADAETLADAYDAAGSGYTAAAEGTYKKVQVWVNGYGGFGEQGSDDDMTGYDFYNVGVMGGLDYAFAKELRVGALFGYTYNNTDLYEDRGESIDNVLRFGAYASYNWNNFFVDLTPTMGIHMIESKRNLITNGTTAKGDRTGIDFNITGTVGYTFVLPAEFMITPSYSLGYTMFYDPDYTETGAGAGNLSVDSFTSNSLVQDLGVKVGKLFCVSDTLSILPEAWGGWEVEYLNTGGDRNSTTASSIGSQSYSTSMNGMATHRGYWGAGMTALINDNISVFGRYDHKIWDKGYNIGFTAGVKVAF